MLGFFGFIEKNSIEYSNIINNHVTVNLIFDPGQLTITYCCITNNICEYWFNGLQMSISNCRIDLDQVKCTNNVVIDESSLFTYSFINELDHQQCNNFAFPPSPSMNHDFHQFPFKNKHFEFV